MRVGFWLLLSLPLLGLAELSAHEYFRHQAPTQEDWELLEPRVKELYHANDLVRVAPEWAEPLLRQQLGSAYFPIDILGRPDLDGLNRAISVSFSGKESRELWNWDLRQTEKVGPFSLRIYENPNPEPAKMRLIERVAPPFLEVFDGQVGDQRLCPYVQNARVSTGGLGGLPTLPATRYACSGGEPFVVAVTTIDDQHFRPRRCIFAHPSPSGLLTLLFHDVALGKKLVGHAGLPWLISRDGSGTPIEITVHLNGERLGRQVIVDQEGFKRFEWPTHQRENTLADLELTLVTQSAQNRNICFTLESR